jgi:hypothetical protein
MAVFNLNVPVITMAVPGTSVCFTIDGTVLEAIMVVAAMAFVLLAGVTGLINQTEFYTFGSMIFGYVATKFFGISNNQG